MNTLTRTHYSSALSGAAERQGPVESVLRGEAGDESHYRSRGGFPGKYWRKSKEILRVRRNNRRGYKKRSIKRA